MKFIAVFLFGTTPREEYIMNTKWYINLLPVIINALSPQFFSELESWIKQLKEYAKKTDNPIDDIFVDLLDRVINPK